MTINERLFKLLKDSNISQKEFSKATNISEQTISAWKSRKTDPPANQLSTIAYFFNVSLDYLITGDKINDINITNESNLIKLTFYERTLINTYRDLNDDGKTKLHDVSKEIWADYRISTKNGQPKGKSYLSQKDELIG